MLRTNRIPLSRCLKSIKLPLLSSTKSQVLLAKRFASHYDRHYQYQQPRRSWSKIFLVTLGGLAVLGGTGWWFLWPHHTFSSSVAKILRKGLWAESERGNFDYQAALKYYLEALELAEKEKLNYLSDEFTGIQLKVGEMYERLGMNQDALMIYSEIASSYLDALTRPGFLPAQLRPHIIQKDLRLVIKMVELNKTNAHASKMLLMTHFLVAQEEVARRSPASSNLIEIEKNELINEVANNTSSTQVFKPDDIALNSPLVQDSISLEPDNKVKVVQKNREAWQPFRDELFNARDLYTAICLATGDLSSAVRAKLATTAWMLNADCDPGEILMSQTNLGSTIYLQAEEFEAKEYHGLQIKAANDEVESNKKSKEACIALASQCYDSVLQFSKKLPAQLRREGNVEEAVALSTYGLGVIKLHLGELDAAKSLLRESRLRAKGSGFSDLVVEAEREMERLQKEFNNLEKEGKTRIDETDRIKSLLQQHENQPDIELDVQLVKNTPPR